MRLTKTIREEMRDKIINGKFNPQIEAVKKKLQTIAQETVDSFYPKKMRDWIKTAPTGALHTTRHVKLLDDDRKVKHDLLGSSSYYGYQVTLKRALIVLAADQYKDEFQVSAKNALKLQDLYVDLDSIEANRADTREVVVSALWACNTRKQLEDTYPELIQYLPKIERQTKALAVTNDAVKKVLS